MELKTYEQSHRAPVASRTRAHPTCTCSSAQGCFDSFCPPEQFLPLLTPEHPQANPSIHSKDLAGGMGKRHGLPMRRGWVTGQVAGATPPLVVGRAMKAIGATPPLRHVLRLGHALKKVDLLMLGLFVKGRLCQLLQSGLQSSVSDRHAKNATNTRARLHWPFA